jgi:hypothetical protein
LTGDFRIALPIQVVKSQQFIGLRIRWRVSTQSVLLALLNLHPADRKKWVPYLSLNKETVMGWCKDALTSDRVKEIENALAARVDAELNKASGLPWDVPDPLPPLPHPLGYVEV